MRSLIKYLRHLVRLLKKQWLIEIRYPKIYPEAQIKSILPKALLENSYGLFVESNVTIKNQNLKIGKHTYIGNNTFIDSCNSIGAFCSISSDVKIGMRNHPLNYISTSPVFYSKYRKWISESTFDERNIRTVTIKDDVLISANVIILNGVKIGRGAVIGAGSIVTRDVPPYAIVAGVPAKIIRYRFSNDQIDLIEQSKWWMKDDKTLKNAIKYSNNPELFISHL